MKEIAEGYKHLLRIAIRQPKLFADAVREDCAEMV